MNHCGIDPTPGGAAGSVVDTLGFLLAVVVTPASVQDRVAARAVLSRVCAMVADRLRVVWADGGYTGVLLGWTWWWRSCGGRPPRHTTRGLQSRPARQPGIDEIN